MFLLGTFGAVFSSLLGVWQSVPYLFADCWGLLRGTSTRSGNTTVDTSSTPYRSYLALIAFVPMLGLFMTFREIQQIYTVIGALFFPVLALGLLILNSRSSWIGEQFRNRPLTIAVLLAVLGFYSWLGFGTA